MLRYFKSGVRFLFLSFFILFFARINPATAQTPALNDLEYFESHGADFLVFSNWYNGLFSDSKISGIEIIYHGERTVTNGDVRLNNTPEQWDPIPTFVERKIDRSNNRIEAYLSYPDYNFNYMIRGEAVDDGLKISVHLEESLPDELAGVAGFNLEFIPSAYYERTYFMDGESGNFPLYPFSDMSENEEGITAPLSLATGHQITLAPEDPERRITVSSSEVPFSLYDGRDKAQNGWFVLRSLIPENKTGKVLEWTINANTIDNWTRKPMIAYSQVGYHPDQNKQATIELDKHATPEKSISLYSVDKDGSKNKVLEKAPEEWGKYQRYNYLIFDFSEITEPGVYTIGYGEQMTSSFRISEDVFDEAWIPTLDIFFPVQMDHVLVNEAYRVWHGASHLDDALQAPTDHEHFDLYAQGPTTDTPYEPGEHIPGLNIGGWYDAGDYDIRTQTHYATVRNLVHAYEDFNIDRDMTTVDQEAKYVDLHNPDGKPDLLQQIEHGTLALIAQYRAVGHAIPGIIVPDISQYTHLGDGLTMTDNLVYNPEMEELESNGLESGKFDDRWAFTSKSSSLDYGSVAALSAASRVLQGYNDELAEECLNTATEVWEKEWNSEPVIFRHGNTTGGRLEDEQFRAAVELLLTTGDQKYAEAVKTLWPDIKERFLFHVQPAIAALPHMDDEYRAGVRAQVEAMASSDTPFGTPNPFSVMITEGGWAGNGLVVAQGISAYTMHKTFPDLVDEEQVFNSLSYLFGNHPDHNLSFVSGVGTKSKKVAYGMNRADFSFIAGGVVPGVLILDPDYPENKEDWPFFWGENEYVIGICSSYIYLVHAALDLLDR